MKKIELQINCFKSSLFINWSWDCLIDDVWEKLRYKYFKVAIIDNIGQGIRRIRF